MAFIGGKEEGYSSTKIAACFLGNKAENEDILVKCVFDAIYRTCKRRILFYPGDPTPVTPSVEASTEFQETVSRMEEAAAELAGFLNKYSLPFYSMRYQGHMNWDTTLPSIIGYFTAMLDNPNNVSIQGATATTLLERMVGLDICGMIGFDQSTLAYAFNKRGNTDLESANYLNCAMFHNLYPNPTKEFEPIPIDQFDMFVTMTTFKGDEYGEEYMEDFANGLGVYLPDPKTSAINCLRSVVMGPWMVNTLDISEDFIGSTLIPALLDAAEDADGEPVIESCKKKEA